MHVHGFLATRSLRVYLPAAAPFRPPCMLRVLACAACLRVCVRAWKKCMCVFARTSLSGVNWTGSPKLGLGPRPSSLSSGSGESLSASLINSMSSG